MAVISRKVEGEDFQGIMIDSYSRLARSEVDSSRLFAEAGDAELLIYTVKEGLMNGEGAWAKRGAATDQSVGYGRDLARNVNRGVTDRIEDGLIPPVTNFPWGVDRVYYSSDGSALFRVRRLLDGTKAVMNPLDENIVQYTIPATERRLHFRQSSHRYELVPGEQSIRQVICDIFEKKYVHAWPSYRIATYLNRQGIKSSTGKYWHNACVEALVDNPLYIGVAVGCVRSTGRHTERRLGSPLVFPVQRRPGYKKNGKGKRRTMKAKFRPPSEWLVCPQPAMKSFLSAEVRQAAEVEWRRKQSQGWEKRIKKPRQQRDPKIASPYFLSRIIKSKRDNFEMVGSGGKGKEDNYYYRFYRATRFVGHGKSESVRADLVEEVVKESLSMVLSECRNLKKRIEPFVHSRRKALDLMGGALPALLKEKAELESWYRSSFSVAGVRGQSLLREQADSVEMRLDEIDAAVIALGADTQELRDNVDDIVGAVCRQFKKLMFGKESNDYESLRALSRVFVSSLTYDPQSREVALELALPSWAMAKSDELVRRVSMAKKSGDQVSFHTEKPAALSLFSGKWKSEKRGRKTQLTPI